MSDIVFVSDFFVEQVLGGGELNDYECHSLLSERGFTTHRVNSHLLSVDDLDHNHVYIISNFINLSEQVKDKMSDYKYIIYEHDHKYIKNRNPALFVNFVAPDNMLINIDFYKNAKAVLCQSEFHMDIVYKNTKLNNLINLSGNLWSKESLDFMSSMCDKEKTDSFAILDSKIGHKNTTGCVNYCLSKGGNYNLISDNNYFSFLTKLGKNKKFIFIPRTPETLSRVCVEARMMNMSVVVNELVGASKESWFSLKGKELVELMFSKRETIIDTMLGILDEK
tara:strand:- start:1044 stop:1883 length:840 start_codon:yes stop_codon:yes gene_type:complete